MMVNRYEIRSVEAGGAEGPLIAMAQQKRMAFKEQVTFYADEARTQPVFGFKARKRIDLAATYDVTDASGTPIGSFREEFAKSLLRSSWELTAADGLVASGTERNHTVAIARRLWELVPAVGARAGGERAAVAVPVSLRLHRAGRFDRPELRTQADAARPLRGGASDVAERLATGLAGRRRDGCGPRRAAVPLTCPTGSWHRHRHLRETLTSPTEHRGRTVSTLQRHRNGAAAVF